MTLNERSWRLVDQLAAHPEAYRVVVHHVAGARVIDCGGATIGGLEAGLLMARACLGDRAAVEIQPSSNADLPFPTVQVHTDDPVRACLASQYAGWQIKLPDFFAMASGPMRAAYGREPLFNDIHGREQPPCAVGILETHRHPTPEVIEYLVGKMPTCVEKIALLVAPTASIAGTLQVTARAVETALHKLHELKFDVHQVLSGHGCVPLPPIAANDLTAIGWTNDAILYAGRVTLWVRADDDLLVSIGAKVPASASSSFGRPFAELLREANGDFYKLDPLLFAPAEVTFCNLKTGRVHRFGQVRNDILKQSVGL